MGGAAGAENVSFPDWSSVAAGSDRGLERPGKRQSLQVSPWWMMRLLTSRPQERERRGPAAWAMATEAPECFGSSFPA
jgi:hypothetical protein